MAYKNKQAFTVIELIMTMIIVSALASSGAYILVRLIQNIVYAPRQMNAEMIAENIFDSLIDGDTIAKGLRFSQKILTITDNNQFSFQNQDVKTVIYRYDLTLNKIFRSINGGAWAQIPLVMPAEINLSLVGGKFLTYYDANEAVTAVPANVRRIEINLIVKTGSGLFSEWQGYSAHKSSMAVNKYVN